MAITNLVPLRDYILGDPDALGFQPYVDAGDNATITDMMNLKRPEPAFDVPVRVIPVTDILEALNRSEFEATDQLALSRLTILFKLDPFPIKKQKMRNMVLDCVGAESATAIEALTIRDGSATEKIYEADDVVTWQQVAAALEIE